MLSKSVNTFGTDESEVGWIYAGMHGCVLLRVNLRTLLAGNAW